MTDLARLRVRAHLPAGPPARPRAWWTPEPDAPALLVHVRGDERDRLTVATSRELASTGVGPLTIGERLFAPAHTLDELRAVTFGLVPDVPAGLDVNPIAVRPVDDLGKLITRRSYRSRFPVVGWNLPWTLGRLAAQTGRAVGRGGGFSIALAGTGILIDDRWASSWDHPRLTITARSGGQSGAFFRWTAPHSVKARYRGDRPADFLDLQVLASALAGVDFDDPAQACRWFGVPWPTATDNTIADLRNEAAALAQLYAVLLDALVQVAPGMAPRDVWSFGSIGGYLLDDAGIRAPLRKAGHVPMADLGAAASATFGGLFRGNLVGVVAPMVLIDIASTYPTMFSLHGLTSIYACESIDSVERDSHELLALLRDIQALWRRETWRAWGLTFAVIRPCGQPLPASVDTGNRFAMTVADLDLSGGTACFHWADLAAAVYRGCAPDGIDIVRVFTLRPVGVQSGLRPLRLPTGRQVDLVREDLGAVLVEERARTACTGPRWLDGLLKALANALTYGLLARADARVASQLVDTVAYGPTGEALTTRTRRPEKPGPHAFLPAASAVSAGARLILAMAEYEIARAGGTVVAVHADSLTVICSDTEPDTMTPNNTASPAAEGHGIRALPADVLRTVLERFAPLGVRFKWDVPATPNAVGLIVGVNRGIYTTHDAVSGDLTMARSSDAGLGGHVADPSDTPGTRLPDGRWQWAADCEVHIVHAANRTPDRTAEAGIRTDRLALPSWTNRPVVRRYAAGNWPMLQLIRADSGDPDVQPFTRYVRADASGPIAIGPWPDARTWTEADWRLGGQPVGLEALGPDGRRHPLGRACGIRAVVPSVATHLRGWANPDDPSMQGPRRGRRTAKPVQSAPGLVLVVGKDGDELMSADADPADQHQVHVTYGLAAGDELRARAEAVGVRELARRTGIAFETLRQWTRGAQTAHENIALIAASLGNYEPDATCAMPACTSTARRRSPWCGDAHRKAASRSRATQTLASSSLPARAPDDGRPL